MALVLEIAFVAAVAVVAASLAAVAFGRPSERLLLGLTVVLALAALAGAVIAGIEIAEGTDDSELLLVTVGGLALAALGEAGLFLLARRVGRVRELEQVEDEARARLDAYLQEQADQRRVELERVLARERANAASLLGEQERRLAEERRDSVARQAESARIELTEAVSSAQGRLETRLMAWAADLDRSQRELEAQLNKLGQRQREALAEYDARLSADGQSLYVDESRIAALAEFQVDGGELTEQGSVALPAGATPAGLAVT